MDVIVIDTEAFEQLKSELKGYVKSALAEFIKHKDVENKSDWISWEDAKKLLPYKSKTTWQKFRDTGTLKFTQNGRNILYSKKSILEFLNNNAI